MATTPGTRGLRADAERNRQRLIDAAAELFAERGLDVPLPEIAAHAGVGVATAYRRFPEREALVDELFDQRLAKVAAAARAGLDVDDPWQGFVRSLTGILEELSSNMGVKQLMMGEVSSGERHARLRAQLLPVMQELMARAQASGQLRDDVGPTDIPILNLMITSGMQATQPYAPEHWRRMLAIVLDGLRARRDGPSALPGSPLDPDLIPKVMSASAPGARTT